MGSGDWIASASDVRRELKTEVYGVVQDLMAAGWRLRRQSHAFKLYCPCGEDSIAVNGTPRDPARHAVQIRRRAAHCPERHALDR